MKLPKKLYIVAAVLLFAGGASSVLALNPEQKEVTLKQASTLQKENKAAEPPAQALQTEQGQTPTQPQPPAPPAPPAQEAEPQSPTNPFPVGRSSWYVFNKRLEVGKQGPISDGVPHANNICNALRLTGSTVTTTPVQHAVVCVSYNHVAFIELLNSDGSFWMSEMNSRGYASMDTASPQTGGFNRVDYKLVAPDRITQYEYIP